MVVASNLTILSVASMKRKLLKTTHTEERSVHANSESCNIRLRLLKINLIPTTCNHRFFSMQSYKVDKAENLMKAKCIFFLLYCMGFGQKPPRVRNLKSIVDRVSFLGS